MTTSNKYLFPPIVIKSFFLIGIISTLAIRLIIVVKHYDESLVRVAWYVGVIGYVIFFAYRYYVTMKRKNLIIKHQLLAKIQQANNIADDDKALLEYIVASIVSSKEHHNYLFIFASSIIAIMIDIVWESLK